MVLKSKHSTVNTFADMELNGIFLIIDSNYITVMSKYGNSENTI